MSDSVLSKLLAADSDLESQEAKLTAQLATIQAQRASLQTVLDIFEPDKTTAADKNGAIAPTQMTDVVVVPPTEKPAQASSKQEAKATKGKPTQPRKTATRSKYLRRGWQKYMRDEYLQTPLPTVVSGILQAQPKKMFKIADVIDAIVAETIPNSARKNARNRISNILAEGARKHQWHRPEAGRYRFAN
ncbi:MAG: hypothetical protein QNJ46_32845 [Leptolyngbyaceae cyanobacterium MO_188.B28]|nr:hypothetical protein [Leptolyngbyaceae cyanobacterium MO_188.B28]